MMGILIIFDFRMADQRIAHLRLQVSELNQRFSLDFEYDSFE